MTVPCYADYQCISPAPHFQLYLSAYLLLPPGLPKELHDYSACCAAASGFFFCLVLGTFSPSPCSLGMGAFQLYIVSLCADTWPEQSNSSRSKPGWVSQSTLSLYSCVQGQSTFQCLHLVLILCGHYTELAQKILFFMPFCSERLCLIFSKLEWAFFYPFLLSWYAFSSRQSW